MKRAATEDDFRRQELAATQYKQFCQVITGLNYLFPPTDNTTVFPVNDGLLFVDHMGLCRDTLELFQRGWDHCFPIVYSAPLLISYCEAEKTFIFDKLTMHGVDSLFDHAVSEAVEHEKKWSNVSCRHSERRYMSPYLTGNVILVDSGKLTLIDHAYMTFTPYHTGVCCVVSGYVESGIHKGFSPNLYQPKEGKHER